MEYVDTLKRVMEVAQTMDENQVIKDMMDVGIKASTAIQVYRGTYRSSGKWMAPSLEKLLDRWAKAS